MLKRYAEIKLKITELQNELTDIESELQGDVEKSGEMSGHGYRAFMKPGRKSTDHQTAAKASGDWAHLAETYSTTKTTVRWAAVTKAMGIDLAPYTSVSPATFTVARLPKQ